MQIDPVGGIDVNAGVIRLANSGVSPGAYPKVTADAKGRVTAGNPLTPSDVTDTLGNVPANLRPSKARSTVVSFVLTDLFP